MIFARGAVKAALWARGQKPGLYIHGRRAGPWNEFCTSNPNRQK